MYDPFATPPPPGTMQTTGVQQNQVMPHPHLASNNALASLYNKYAQQMFPNGMPNGMPGGPNTQFPLNPGAGNPGGGPQDGWRQDFRQARSDWRGDMPDRPMFEGPRPDDWRTQMDAYQGQRRDWRDLRPRARDYRMGTVPASGV